MTTATHHQAIVEKTDTAYQALVDGVVVAQSNKTLLLKESYNGNDSPPVVYFPMDSLNRTHCEPSSHQTYCPIKGVAKYFHLVVNGNTLENAAWYYPEPVEQTQAIKNFVAFYPNRVTVS